MEINREYMTDKASYDWNDPTHVVVHYTAGADGVTAEANAIYYTRAAEQIQASAHYFLGDDGIFAFTPEYRGAWTNGNWEAGHHSITIEVACGTWEPGFTATEIALLAELVRDIMARYGIPAENVIRHYDIVDRFGGSTVDPHKACPRQYIDQDAWAALHAIITGGGTSDMVFCYRPNAVGDTIKYYDGTAIHTLQSIEEYEAVRLAYYYYTGKQMPLLDLGTVDDRYGDWFEVAVNHVTAPNYGGGASIDYAKLAEAVSAKIGDAVADKVADKLAKRLAD